MTGAASRDGDRFQARQSDDRRAGVRARAHLGLGYVAATLSGAFVAAVTMTTFTYSMSAASLSVDILFEEAKGTCIFAALFFALSLPAAWAPLSISLPVFRLRFKRMPACLASGALTGAVLTAWFVWLDSIVPSFGAEDDPSPLWRTVLVALPLASHSGLSAVSSCGLSAFASIRAKTVAEDGKLMARRSEDALIAHYFAPLAGPGGLGLRDDAALATPRAGHDLVVTKDMLVAGGHFFADDPPGVIARKALRVNLSDLAAKGATPMGFLLGLALPSDWTEAWLAGFVAALAEDASAFACPLLGGDTIAMPDAAGASGPLTLSITAFGEVPAGRMVPRTGARAGDRLYVSGTIGDAALGLQVRRDERADAAWLAALDPAASQALLKRHRQPRPRLALAPALLAHARAAMDVSDGFLGDLTKMLRLEGLTATVAVDDVPLSDAARAAIRLEPRLAATALTGGDDYEILCAVAPEGAAAFERAAGAAGVAVARVGTAVPGAAIVTLTGPDRAPLAIAATSFQHFS